MEVCVVAGGQVLAFGLDQRGRKMDRHVRVEEREEDAL